MTEVTIDTTGRTRKITIVATMRGGVEELQVLAPDVNKHSEIIRLLAEAQLCVSRDVANKLEVEGVKG